jgi:gliding motility-associated transport system ATP-binding protein
VITVSDLCMHYGPVVALHKATFNVERGEVVGLLGPNGAGKSTTMKLLTTYLYPTFGHATVGGKSIRNEAYAVRKLIGYLPEVLPLYPDMEVRAYLDFVGRARGLRGGGLRQRTSWVVEHCGLRPMYRKLVRELSKGYRQRVALAQALIHDPQVVILDEPTSGLDPHQIQEIRQLIRQLAHDKTVLLSTHILQEVEAVADRLVIINAGRIVGDGTLPELQQKTQRQARALFAVVAPQAEVETALKELRGVRRLRSLGATESVTRFELQVAQGVPVLSELGALAQARGWQVSELQERPPTLEEVFLALTEPQESQSDTGA